MPKAFKDLGKGDYLSVSKGSGDKAKAKKVAVIAVETNKQYNYLRMKLEGMALEMPYRAGDLDTFTDKKGYTYTIAKGK